MVSYTVGTQIKILSFPQDLLDGNAFCVNAFEVAGGLILLSFFESSVHTP